MEKSLHNLVPQPVSASLQSALPQTIDPSDNTVRVSSERQNRIYSVLFSCEAFSLVLLRVYLVEKSLHEASSAALVHHHPESAAPNVYQSRRHPIDNAADAAAAVEPPLTTKALVPTTANSLPSAHVPTLPPSIREKPRAQDAVSTSSSSENRMVLVPSTREGIDLLGFFSRFSFGYVYTSCSVDHMLLRQTSPSHPIRVPTLTRVSTLCVN